MKIQAQQNRTLQSGFILIIMLVILVVGAAVFFGSNPLNIAAQRDAASSKEIKASLNKAKAQLITYMILTPEIQQTKSTTSPPELHDINRTPGPGYLPCWDIDGDGAMDCSFSPGNYQPRFFTSRITTRNLFFSEHPEQFYYVLDPRYAIQNSSFHNTTTKRYAPLNNTITPALRLNNDGRNYVALIIYTGSSPSFTQPLNNINNDGDAHFFSKSLRNPGVTDYIVGITKKEWQTAINRRICNLSTSLLTTDPTTAFWFNNYHPTTNPIGSSWRSLVNGGLCP